jgi:AcrR family transcriptional regulator
MTRRGGALDRRRRLTEHALVMTGNRFRSSVKPETLFVATSPTAAPVTTRERILDAADLLLARFGYRKMTVEDIAQEAGIGKGTVYLSFPSKEEVALGCIDRMVDQLLARLAAIAGSPRPASERLRELLVARVLHRFDYARAHAASIDALLAGARSGLLTRRLGHFAAEARVIERLLHAAPELASDDAARDAEALITATNALLPYSLSPRELGNRAAVERRALAVADLLVRGLSSPPPARGRARASLSRSSR